MGRRGVDDGKKSTLFSSLMCQEFVFMDTIDQIQAKVPTFWETYLKIILYLCYLAYKNYKEINEIIAHISGHAVTSSVCRRQHAVFIYPCDSRKNFSPLF